MHLSEERIRFLNDDYLVAKRMRYLMARLQGYDLPCFFVDVLLQATDDERLIWQAVEDAFVFAKKSSSAGAQQMAKILSDLANKGWHEYSVEKAKQEGGRFAQAISPDVLVAEGLQLQYAKNPYVADQQSGSDLAVAWQEGFHNYLCFMRTLREESW